MNPLNVFFLICSTLTLFFPLPCCYKRPRSPAFSSTSAIFDNLPCVTAHKDVKHPSAAHAAQIESAVANNCLRCQYLPHYLLLYIFPDKTEVTHTHTHTTRAARADEISCTFSAASRHKKINCSSRGEAGVELNSLTWRY